MEKPFEFGWILVKNKNVINHFSRYTQNGRSPNLPSSTSKKPRRRVATVSQRRAANIRERRRMFNLNEAFDKLRRKVPNQFHKQFSFTQFLNKFDNFNIIFMKYYTSQSKF